MANNRISKYNNLVTSEKKPEVFNQIPKKEISYEELERVSQQHAGEIIRITKKLADTIRKVENLEEITSKQTNEQKSISNLLVFSQWQAYYSQQEFFALKRWFWVFVGAAALVIIGWIFEAYYKFGEVKSEYIKQTEQFQIILANEKKEFEISKKDLENKLENIQKDHDRLKDDNDDLKNELEYLRSRLDKVYK